MTGNQLVKLSEQLKLLEQQLVQHKAPKSMVRRVSDALLAVSWEIDYCDR